MFRLRDDPTPYRVAGIDPGTDTLGFSVLDLDLKDGEIRVEESLTLFGSKMVKERQGVADVHGARFARLQGLEEALVQSFFYWKPHAIICESPFYNPRRPGAYAALIEAVGMVQRAVYGYAPQMALLTIDPASAKALLGVSGKSGDKDLVKQAIVKRTDIHNPHGIDLTALDEHSIDSLAIAYYRIAQVKDQLLL